MNTFSVYVSMKPVYNTKAKSKAEAAKKAQARYPGFRILSVRDNGPVLRIDVPKGWDVAETAVTDEDPECRYCGRATSQCDHPALSEIESFCPDCGHLIECCTCYDSGDKVITSELEKPSESKPKQYTRKMTKAQVRAEIRNTGSWTGRILPCKANPNSPWFSSTPNTFEPAGEFSAMQYFEDFVNAFEMYNCTTNELGKYAAYYGEEL